MNNLLTDERGAFEAWVGKAFDTTRTSFGAYVATSTQLAWMAWEKRAAIESEVRASVPAIPLEPTVEWFKKVVQLAGVWPGEDAPDVLWQAAQKYHRAMLAAAAPQCQQPQISSIGDESNIPANPRVIPKGSGAVIYHSGEAQ